MALVERGGSSMMSSSFIAKRLRPLLRDDRGVALVEFAVTLPIMIFLFAIIIEGGRMMMSYQSAISGVRDATRYLARTAPGDICDVTGGSLAAYSAQLQTLVTQGLSSGSVFAPGVTIDSVTPSYRCVAGSFRGGAAPVAEVTAQITITFPFAGIITFLGGNQPTLVKTVTDQARIFGS